MSKRFFLSEQEIEKRYGNPIISIRENYTRSYIYYDAENDQFIEERYHEEYLDTGTVCDGCYVVSDGFLWKELVRTCNEEGMAIYLKYRNHIPEAFELGKTVTMEEFLNGLNALMENNPRCQYFCEENGSIFVITNELKTILCKIGKIDNYFFFFNPKSDVQKQGFQSLEEALAKALDMITSYHNNRPECDCKVNEQKGYHVGEAYKESFSKTDEKSNPKKGKRSVCILKKIGLALIVLVILLFTVGCVNANFVDSTKPTEKATVNFDLSQYDSHGELSCDRIWVVKTISDWDTAPAKYFAYLDANGNVIYDWTPVGTARYAGYSVDAMVPQDYVNNYAMIIDERFGTTSTQQFILLDHNGNELYSPARIYVKYNNARDFYITDFDEDGYAYFIGRVWWDGNTEGDYGVYWMDDAGIHKFNAQLPDIDSTLHAIERMDNYYFISVGVYSILFDLQGNPIIDFNEAAGILPDSIEIINDKYIEAVFKGKDDNLYVCIIDFDGNFIKSPVLESQYVRNQEELV